MNDVLIADIREICSGLNILLSHSLIALFNKAQLERLKDHELQRFYDVCRDIARVHDASNGVSSRGEHYPGLNCGKGYQVFCIKDSIREISCSRIFYGISRHSENHFIVLLSVYASKHDQKQHQAAVDKGLYRLQMHDVTLEHAVIDSGITPVPASLKQSTDTLSDTHLEQMTIIENELAKLRIFTDETVPDYKAKSSLRKILEALSFCADNEQSLLKRALNAGGLIEQLSMLRTALSHHLLHALHARNHIACKIQKKGPLFYLTVGQSIGDELLLCSSLPALNYLIETMLGYSIATPTMKSTFDALILRSYSSVPALFDDYLESIPWVASPIINEFFPEYLQTNYFITLPQLITSLRMGHGEHHLNHESMADFLCFFFTSEYFHSGQFLSQEADQDSINYIKQLLAKLNLNDIKKIVNRARTLQHTPEALLWLLDSIDENNLAIVPRLMLALDRMNSEPDVFVLWFKEAMEKYTAASDSPEQIVLLLRPHLSPLHLQLIQRHELLVLPVEALEQEVSHAASAESQQRKVKKKKSKVPCVQAEANHVRQESFIDLDVLSIMTAICDPRAKISEIKTLLSTIYHKYKWRLDRLRELGLKIEEGAKQERFSLFFEQFRALIITNLDHAHLPFYYFIMLLPDPLLKKYGNYLLDTALSLDTCKNKKKFDFIKLLLAKGLDINAQDLISEKTSMMSEQNLLSLAIFYSDDLLDQMQIVINSGINIDLLSPHFNHKFDSMLTPLAHGVFLTCCLFSMHRGLFSGTDEEVASIRKNIMKANGYFNPSSYDKYFQGAFYIADRSNPTTREEDLHLIDSAIVMVKFKTIELLLKNGANQSVLLGQEEKRLYSLLDLALTFDVPELILLLRNAGCQPVLGRFLHIPFAGTYQSIAWVLQAQIFHERFRAAIVENRYIPFLKKMSSLQSIEYTIAGLSYVLVAVEMGSLDALKHLHEEYDLNLLIKYRETRTNYEGKYNQKEIYYGECITPLDLAMRLKKWDIVEYLLSQMKLDCDFARKQSLPLHAFVKGYQNEPITDQVRTILTELLGIGFSVNDENEQEVTAPTLALNQKKTEAARLLLTLHKKMELQASQVTSVSFFKPLGNVEDGGCSCTGSCSHASASNGM